MWPFHRRCKSHYIAEFQAEYHYNQRILRCERGDKHEGKHAATLMNRLVYTWIDEEAFV